ncbi:hydroxyacylglutathione hydrolase [Paraperlucidibaca baekdonensis]|uniref:Hydroxyacylglutathione hydrolase n=1 Tax=Paraperlucidibaca baekdonensis TaxID=748120 RepID=A0A3E0H3G7_9GAMM|nr:MBL fold metallo-hydrolase [Paraperlucidibaca baekdonensis]REH37848.1 hydroxyacylglutathione hydrolase [Paraperlucidibaca baekdonensis]
MALTDSVALPIIADTPQRLSARVWRMTAANPSIMTGPGTNSYLLIGARCVALVDPGPADAAHHQALLAAVAETGLPLTHILLTHTHRDHSPGTSALVAATGARVCGMFPLADDPSQDRDTVIDETLVDGQCFDALGWPLEVIHTPGHVENHLCFHCPDEHWLITGDHIIQGSTVVIIPPHGRLGDYVRSLNKLLGRGIKYLLPGHGSVMPEAESVVAATVAHRLKREQKVIDALAAHPPASLADWVPIVYDDVSPSLHPIARFSLWAHLLKLAEDGVVTETDGIWQPMR